MEEHEFKEKLTPEQYRVMREYGTETPHTGKYWKHDETGLYTCAACGSILFLSLHKLKSENGWPTFTKPASMRNVVLTQEGGRTEVSCKKCASHLGYFVEEGKHYQINSIALGFQELPDIEWEKKDGDDKSKDSKQSPQTTPAKTISLTIGGLTIGAVIGAGAMWAATPPAMCTPSAAQVTQLPASNTTTNSSGSVPRSTGGTASLPASSVISPASTSTPGSAGATSSAATSSSAGGSAATTTP